MAQKQKVKTTAGKKKKTGIMATNKKVLPSAVDHTNSIELSDTAAALVLDIDNSVKVYVSNNNQDETNNIYAPNEELCIALAALLQNQTFVESTLKTFRELFEAAIAKKNMPVNGIDE